MLESNYSSHAHESSVLLTHLVRRPPCHMAAASHWLNSSALLVSSLPLAAWAGAVAAGTIAPLSPLGILSVRKSLKELTASRSSRLNVLDVFRVVAILWVVMNHLASEGRVDILERRPSANEFKRAVHEHPVFGALLGNSALGVEVFLVLSGLLAARSWMKQQDEPFWDHYGQYLSRRVFRLFPSIAFFLYFAAGPIMRAMLPRFHETMITGCGAGGITAHLSFAGNWRETPTCLGYLWYISLDMQLHLMAPFFVHFLCNRPSQTLSAIAATVSVSCVLRALYCTSYGICNKSDVDIPFITFPGVDVESMKGIYEGVWEMYARPYTKCGPFLIGLVFGWASVHFEKNKNFFTRRMSWLMFVVGLLTAVLTIYAILPEYWWPEMKSNVYNVTYTATFRTVFAFAIIAMIAAFTLATNVLPISVYWSVLARLTFSAYLVHMPVVYIFNWLDFLQQAQDAIALLIVFPAAVVLAFVVAFPFYIFVESPIGRLVSSWDEYKKNYEAPAEKCGRVCLNASDFNSSVKLIPSPRPSDIEE